MGTRNLTMIILNGETKVAQYGQWDGYPSGQGITALEFLTKCDLDVFKEKVKELSFLTDPEIEEIDKLENWKAVHPYLSRDVAAEILEAIYADKVKKLNNHEGFVNDSLFNEWTYVIDLDKNTFEVYGGFNKEALSKDERFYNETPSEEGYYPVKLIKVYSLLDLPTKEEFLKLEEVEEDNETTQP